MGVRRWRCLNLAALLVVLSLLGATRAADAGSYLNPSSYEKPFPRAVLGADLDDDGSPDAAVVDLATLSLFYGNGDGSLGPRADLPLGNGLVGLKAADINGDGRTDLLATQDGTLLVLLNQGQRAYAPAVSYSAGSGPSDLTVADFNNDGKLDVAMFTLNSQSIAVLLNHGDGTFDAPLLFTGAIYPTGITHGDFNRDGAMDLATTDFLWGTVQIYLGDGTGRLTPGESYLVAGIYSLTLVLSPHVVSADFNGDDIPDLATAGRGAVGILIGDGTGRFAAPAYYVGGSNDSGGIAAADLDGDGDTDLAWAHGEVGYFYVLENSGAGGFAPPRSFDTQGFPTLWLSIADFNRDGVPDVVASNLRTNNISVSLGVTPAVLTGPGGHMPASLPVYNPANGHWYQAIHFSGTVRWNDARAAAEAWRYRGLAGHLATITSDAESDFITSQVPTTYADFGRWLVGGYQDRSAPDYEEPTGGWRWVTGEPFTFTHWEAGEPNDQGGEDVMEFRSNGRANDLPAWVGLGGYLVEYEAPAVPGVAQTVVAPNPVPGGHRTGVGSPCWLPMSRTTRTRAWLPARPIPTGCGRSTRAGPRLGPMRHPPPLHCPRRPLRPG
jgi:hypothetical protein